MDAAHTGMARNIALYPWFKFFQNLLFWQAIWFLYFQSELSAAEAVLLYVTYDIATTLLEVPSGYMSDRLGRRKTLIAAATASVLGSVLIAIGGGFGVLALGQILLGAGSALASGTDSALLYESLDAEGRQQETETQEARAWRFNLSGLALSAIAGGVIAQFSFALAFSASAVAMAAALSIAWKFHEPARNYSSGAAAGLAEQWALWREAMRQPVLIWLFVLSMLMYAYSHLPFVFGQPFIAEALDGLGLAADAPVVSGAVTALMMLVSVAASFLAMPLRRRIGLAAILLLSFGLQIGLITVLVLSNSVVAIAVLFLRIVPDSLSYPFVIARIQPLLSDEGRATFLSIKSLAGRMFLAASLLAVSSQVSDQGALGYADIRYSLTWYVGAGLVFFAVLALSARRAGVNRAMDGQRPD